MVELSACPFIFFFASVTNLVFNSGWGSLSPVMDCLITLWVYPIIWSSVCGLYMRHPRGYMS